jgi:exosortase A-associated hydrolase 1
LRRLIAFRCAGETLMATLDTADGATGLLVVSGGNEIRVGAHRGMAMLAQRVAEAGHPVLRFDRRGIGDSTGDNRGFESSAEDIAAAAALLRAETGVARVVGYGNCDAASALAFFHAQAGIDALLLANPFAAEPRDELPPAAAIRSHYADRLRDPKQWLRLLRGGVDLGKLARGLTRMGAGDAPGDLAERLTAALAAAQVPVTVLLASGDNTAIAFADAVDTAALPVRVETLDSASHSFASVADKDWLFERVRAGLGG